VNNEKIHQVALSYRKTKNKYYKADISTIDAAPGVHGVSKDAPESNKHAIWGLVLKYCPKVGECSKKSKKTGFFDVFFFNFDSFLQS
jgi:hypothetical protein